MLLIQTTKLGESALPQKDLVPGLQELSVKQGSLELSYSATPPCGKSPQKSPGREDIS